MLINTGDAHILALTTDAETKEFLRTLLEGESYTFTHIDNPRVLDENLSNHTFDLVILDDIESSALDLCKKIRANFTLRYLPIILLVDAEDTIEKIKGIYAGADDYIIKPLQAGELLTRIKANLWRAKRDLDANPLTKLPGNVSILKEIEHRLKTNEIFCAAYADLNKFKEYNDHYGFEWGDKIIKNTASIISGALLELGTSKDFLGHIGGDDFIFITSWDGVKNICEKILTDFDATITDFYRDEDLTNTGILVKNRAGKMCRIPVMSISIGVTTNKFRQLTHLGEVIQLATELKSYAKTFDKSIYVIDRRRG